MKRTRKVLFALTLTAAVVLMLLTLFSSDETLAAENLVQNAGFETGGTPPQGWHLEDEARGKGTIEFVNSPGGSGKAVKLSPNRRNGGERPLALGQMLPLKDYIGKRLHISGYLGAEGGTKALLAAFILKGDGGIGGQLVLTQEANGGKLEMKRGSIEVTGGDAQSLILVCGTEGKSGSAYFDDIIVGSDQPAARIASEADTGTQSSLTASVSIDANTVIRQIPRTLYGTNVEWIFDGNLLWDKAKGDFHPQLVQMTKDLGVTLVRFPGGGFSDFYHWRDGIGDRASRKETDHEPGGGSRSQHNFGTDEALDFARRIGGELLITPNVSTGTAEEAADWVSYVNKPNRRVTYWEIGNEVYMSGGNPATPGKAMNARAYAEKVLAFARAMRARDPGIKIGAVGGDNYGSYSFVDNPNWNKEVLQIAGKEIDFFSVHNSYAPIVIEKSTNTDVRAVYSAMLAAPLQIRESLRRVSSQIRQYVPSKAGQIRIAVTEWGPLFHPEHDSPLVDHVKTLGSGIFVASAFSTFLHSTDTDIANFFKLNEITFMGWIGSADDAEVTRPAGERQYRAKAPYLAMQLYTKHFGPTLVKADVAAPAYRSPKQGLIESIASVPYLDAASSLSADKSKLYVMLINKSFDRGIQAKLNINGFTPAGSGSSWRLEGSGIDAHTATKLPRGIGWAKQLEDKVNPRFSKSGPNDVRVVTASVPGTGPSFAITLPPASVTALELPVKR